MPQAGAPPSLPPVTIPDWPQAWCGAFWGLLSEHRERGALAVRPRPALPGRGPGRHRSPEASSFSLARIMGTSVAMIDQTYGRLLPDSRSTCGASR
jgi:hypothetical protein